MHFVNGKEGGKGEMICRARDVIKYLIGPDSLPEDHAEGHPVLHLRHPARG